MRGSQGRYSVGRLSISGGAILFVMLPVVLGDSYLVRTFVLLFINAIALLGLYVTTGMAGQVSLCHGALLGFGAYTSAILAIRSPLPVAVCIVMASLATGLLGLVLASWTVRLRAHYLALATIGFGEILLNIFRNGGGITGGANGLGAIPPLTIGSLKLTSPIAYYYVVLPAFLVAWAIVARIGTSPYGKVLVAMQMDEDVLPLIGFRPGTYRAIAFAIGGMSAGLAGALYAHMDRFIGPETYHLGLSIAFLGYLVIGGVRSPWGVAIGATFSTLGPEYLRKYAEWQMVIVGGLSLAILAVSHEGIAGLIRTWGRWGLRTAIPAAPSVLPVASEAEGGGSSE